MSVVYNLCDLYVGDIFVAGKNKNYFFPHKTIVGVEEKIIDPRFSSLEVWKQEKGNHYSYQLFPHFSSFGQVLGLYKEKKELDNRNQGCYVSNLKPLYEYMNQIDKPFTNQHLLRATFINEEMLLECYSKIRAYEKEENKTESFSMEEYPNLDYLHYKLGFLEGRIKQSSLRSGVPFQKEEQELDFDNFYQMGFHTADQYYQYHPLELARTEGLEELIKQHFTESLTLHNMIYGKEKPLVKVLINEDKKHE